MPILAQQLVDLHPDVIVSITTPATAALKATTGSIPIVFAYVGDPGDRLRRHLVLGIIAYPTASVC